MNLSNSLFVRWQLFNIVADEESPPKAAKYLVDMIGDTLVFGVVAYGQIISSAR